MMFQTFDFDGKQSFAMKQSFALNMSRQHMRHATAPQQAGVRMSIAAKLVWSGYAAWVVSRRGHVLLP